MMAPTPSEIRKRLLAHCKIQRTVEAEAHVPREPGIYAIFIDDPKILPDFIATYLANTKHPSLIYVGKAHKTL